MNGCCFSKLCVLTLCILAPGFWLRIGPAAFLRLPAGQIQTSVVAALPLHCVPQTRKKIGAGVFQRPDCGLNARNRGLLKFEAL
jgi:hypothetical protein